MFNSIIERRMQSMGMYAVILQIPEEEFFIVYNTTAPEYAKEIVYNYLKYHGDDGRPENIKISHDKGNRLININLFLYYTDNPHTEPLSIPSLMDMNNSANSAE